MHFVVFWLIQQSNLCSVEVLTCRFENHFVILWSQVRYFRNLTWIIAFFFFPPYILNFRGIVVHKAVAPDWINVSLRGFWFLKANGMTFHSMHNIYVIRIYRPTTVKQTSGLWIKGNSRKPCMFASLSHTILQEIKLLLGYLCVHFMFLWQHCNIFLEITEIRKNKNRFPDFPGIDKNDAKITSFDILGHFYHY